ncbi:MAG: hypothetical protein K0Q43_1854 [Ramlibacter sp.]|jgi:hypothetical protein|nr:hypothetical protein [Ramlibacter sp.]
MASNIIAGAPAPTPDSQDQRDSPKGRAGVIFGEIADLASCVERLGILLVTCNDEAPEDRAACELAIRALSNQIGLLADIGAQLCGKGQLKGSDPAQWLLPPAFHMEGGGNG